MMHSLRRRLADLRLGLKLGGIALLGLGLMLSVAGAGGWAWWRIETGYKYKDTVRQVFEQVQKARIQEKAWLQFYAVEHATALEEACKQAQTLLDRLADDGRGRELRQAIDGYRIGFTALQSAHKNAQEEYHLQDAHMTRMVKEADDLIAAINQRQSILQQEGQELTTNERELVTAVREANLLFLQLMDLLNRFNNSGDEKYLKAFARQLSETGANVQVNLSSITKATKDAKYQEQVKPIITDLRACTPFIGRSRASSAAERTKVKELDDIGRHIGTLADRVANAGDTAVADARRLGLIIAGVVACVGGALFAVSTALQIRAIVRPLTEAVAVAQAIQDGDFQRRVATWSQDEVGHLGEVLNRMSEALGQSVAAVDGHAVALHQDAGALSEVSRRMRSSANEAANQAQAVSAATARSSASLGSVSAATEEMTASIGEIASKASEAVGVTGQAMQEARGAQEVVRRLATSSEEVGTVVHMVAGIAHQTNLLALNATIEAARAGELGKGFAVVANEVKQLARQSAEAAAEISKRIQAMQGDSRAVIDTIAHIAQTIEQINGILTQVAAATEEQSATTSEMARNVSEVAGLGHEVEASISGVAKAAGQASSDANTTLEAATRLAGVAAELRQVVARLRGAG